mgnify:FL=1
MKNQLDLGSLIVAYLIYKVVGNVAHLAQAAHINSGNEWGWTMCEKDGRIVKGSEAVGHPTGVSLSVDCQPCGGKPVGLYHTHPLGSVTPSGLDIREMRRLGLPTLCIQVPETGETACYHVGGKIVKKIS